MGYKVHGVAVAIVCKNVPVVTLDKRSPFDANVSWMLQNACDSYLKVDRHFKYIADAKIHKACKKLGLLDNNFFIMRLYNFPKVKAVGHGGKRACTMACVVAMSIHYPNNLRVLWEELKAYNLHRQYRDLRKLIRMGVRKAAVRDAADAAEKKASMKARDFGTVKVMMRGRSRARR